MLFSRRRHDYGFAHEAAEKRHARYGKAPNHVKDKCKRHGLVQPAKFGEFAFSGHIENASRAHKEKPLIKYMGKGMGDGAVYRHLGTDADRGHHVADLAYDVIGQKPSYIVFQNSIDNAVDRHYDAEPYENVRPGKTPRKGVYRALCRERRHKDGAAYRCLRVGVRKPCP